MSPRKGLLALMGVMGLTALAAGAPPLTPLVEGREPDPVAHEFHQADVPVSGYVASPAATEQPNAGAWVVLTALVWDLFLDRLTFPLGTAVQSEAPTGV